METSPTFDLAAAHKYFAAHCFNRTWDLMEKSDRSLEEDRLMETLNQSSIYHWTQRPDCTPRNISTSYWQASRVQSLLNNPTEAVRFATICLSYSQDLQPFNLGYAHEALARAYYLANDQSAAAEHLAKARELAERVEDAEDRDRLLADLQTIQDRV